MARVLIVGCGCRGRTLAASLIEQGLAVRGTTRRPAAAATRPRSGRSPPWPIPTGWPRWCRSSRGCRWSAGCSGAPRGRRRRTSTACDWRRCSPTSWTPRSAGSSTRPRARSTRNAGGGGALVARGGRRWRLPGVIVTEDPGRHEHGSRRCGGGGGPSRLDAEQRHDGRTRSRRSRAATPSPSAPPPRGDYARKRVLRSPAPPAPPPPPAQLRPAGVRGRPAERRPPARSGPASAAARAPRSGGSCAGALPARPRRRRRGPRPGGRRRSASACMHQPLPSSGRTRAAGRCAPWPAPRQLLAPTARSPAASTR